MKDILVKNLNKYGDEIMEVAEGASDEIRIEVQLIELKKTWPVMQLTYKLMEEFPDLLIPSVPEELVATLRENLLAIQNYLSTEKYFIL
jgi:hypothetical protein